MIIKNNLVKLNYQPSGGKSWIAKILGKDNKYGFNRQFINGIKTNMSSSGKTGNIEFIITEDGYYEVNESWKKNRYYLKVENCIISEINRSDINL